MTKQNPLLYLLKKVDWPKKLVFTAMTLSILGSLSGLLVPLFTGKLVDTFNAESLDLRMVWLFIGVFLVNAVLSGIGTYLLSKIGEKTIYSIREKLWKHLINLKMSFFDKNESGQLMSRITDDTNVINLFISEKAPSVLPSLLTLIGSIVMLFILDWQMTLMTFLILPIFIGIMVPLGRKMGKISRDTQTEISRFSGILGRVLTEMKLVKVTTSEEKELEKTKGTLLGIYDLGLREAKIRAIISPLSGVIMTLTVAVILGFGGIRVSSGAITAGTLVAMIFYVVQLSAPILNFSMFLTDYKKAVGASERIYEIYQEEAEKRGDDHNQPITNRQDITFENVSFGYEAHSVIKDLSLSIRSGEVTAFVGPSGSGKSTLFSLIERLYPIDHGQILYGNQPIDDISLKYWRQKIGYVMQSNAMMSGTIRDNLTYGVYSEVEEETLVHYTKMARCYDFIMAFPQGFDTEIGERGTKLSGGQRQRIDIARSFIKNPDILLLDEATANLDSESEFYIQQALNELMKDRTTIVIAHRLATIKKANQIVFLDKGQITGVGTHQELLASHEKYRHFVNTQSLTE
ncbi:antibiotic ABC transporter ATP-binding protein [Mammaliicoccus sciuri]|uniref:ABC transporter ATP-binding protein n=2 Tax=Mammaliicoccus sciuri TaxID=1296 RepID=UPI000734B0B1|nr:ABC transporter ATP-binding protein [Mammaliicoccus sciuri]KTT86878.1 antibiotic ABC transporter ATP-binding protein [Mammaliicoccus sciuri]KTT87629.1 antibiotic ABC transporter ATP-binding protein [Mammaliicoccus sciuri]KTT90159.1 antibiotic ABC transporter ATP-binding protein [Mammaliicoccus sciuri]KTT93038.1 antibiotic ABC transporter ATP-binding protein [Mammaliicoccus sciuri]KTW12001.1 antibiotic ABC transporter ATP-binding protein [Mammaliicoccus sciuri]